MFREPRQRSTRKQLEKDRLDPMKSHKPEPPVAGPGNLGIIISDCHMPKGRSCLGPTLIQICIQTVLGGNSTIYVRAVSSNCKMLAFDWSACLE